MKNNLFYLLCLILMSGCASRKDLNYLSNHNDLIKDEVLIPKQNIQPLDILKIDVRSSNIEAALPYNRVVSKNQNLNVNLQTLQLEGYMVSRENSIEFPVLGTINTKNKDYKDLENEITDMLINGGHLIDPNVTVQVINRRFTVLGEVRNPGTFSFIGERISLLEAIGYAGDLNITGERSKVLLVRTNGDKIITKEFDLREIYTLNDPSYFIKSNDVIIVRPNFNKVKSAGFIGSPSTITSLATLLLNITILLFQL